MKDGTRTKNGFSGDTVIGSTTLHLTQWQTTTNIYIAQLLWFSLSTITPRLALEQWQNRHCVMDKEPFEVAGTGRFGVFVPSKACSKTIYVCC